MNDLELFAMHHNISIEDVSYLTRNGISVKCNCGRFKELANSKQSKIGIYIYRTCKDSKCEPSYGKKRPGHSAKMKKLVKTGSSKFRATLMKPGVKHNKNVNTIEFKRKRLSNNGIDISNMDDDSALVQYSKLLSDIRKSTATRKVEIFNRYTKWEPEYKKLILDHIGCELTTEYLDSLTEDNIHSLWKFIHGVNTLRNSSKIKKSRQSWFKQELLTGPFKYSGRQSVFVKSGLERKYIEFFEANGIEWEYEPFPIKTKNNSFYVPDFLIKINGETILLEAKGSFYRCNISEYLDIKIAAGIEHAKLNGYRFVLTFKEPDKNYNFISAAFINLK